MTGETFKAFAISTTRKSPPKNNQEDSMLEVVATVGLVMALMWFAEWYTGLDNPIEPRRVRKRERQRAEAERWLRSRTR